MRSIRTFSLITVVLALAQVCWAQTPTRQAGLNRIQQFYRQVFRFGVPMPWKDALGTLHPQLDDPLYIALRENLQGTRTLDFDPFIDRGEASGFKILEPTFTVLRDTEPWGSAAGPEKASVEVEIQGSPNRRLRLDLRFLIDWQVENIHYLWSEEDDLMSILKRRRNK